MKNAKRIAVIKEARTWLSTPFHHEAAVKGAGVDCANLLVEVFHTVMGIARPEVLPYPIDWMMHRDEERFLSHVRQYADDVSEPLPGDIAVWKFGRCFSHGAIVIAWPLIIHAWRKAGMVTLGEADKGELSGREVKFFSMRGI